MLETTKALAHRGPDSSGLYRESGIGLVHTRLSLVDLDKRSGQPMWDNKGRFALVYNGEIYNFRELREQLRTIGVSFKTSGDTEVLLECLINWGLTKTLDKIEGMFAFCFYDAEQKTFQLARDRFGIKPLFVYQDDDHFLFSSEILAIRSWKEFKPDQLSIAAYFQGVGFPTKGFSLIQRVSILAPGGSLHIRRGEEPTFKSFTKTTDLYDPDVGNELSHLKPAQLVNRFDKLFRESIRRQMFADVPVGAYCSGGVDSSLVMAVAKSHHNNLAIFHANVLGDSETVAARALADHLQLDLNIVEFSDQDFVGAIAETIAHFGAPFTYHENSPAFMAVSKLARKNGLKAMLSGEGSDESFLGYAWLAPNWRNYFQSIRLTPRAVLRRLLRNNRSHRKHFDSKPIIDNAGHLYSRFEIARDLADVRQLLPRFIESSNGDSRGLVSFELMAFHLRSLLHRNDALGMAASIEARFPFLDTELVQFAANLPYKYKMRFRPFSQDRRHRHYVDKWIVRQAALRYLPKSLSHRSKLGFPASAYKRMTIQPALLYNGFVQDMLELSSKDIDFFFENASQNMKLKFLHLESWAEIFIAGKNHEVVQERLNRYLTI